MSFNIPAQIDLDFVVGLGPMFTSGCHNGLAGQRSQNTTWNISLDEGFNIVVMPSDNDIRRSAHI